MGCEKILLLLLLPSIVHSTKKTYHPSSKDGSETEYPHHFEIPLPHECTVLGTGAKSYNQGFCSRRPCRNHKDPFCSSFSNNCCYEVGTTAAVNLICSDSQSPNIGHVIVTCTCQPCSQLQVEISGKVISSLDNKPVVLATVIVNGEIVTFTNQYGAFSFEIVPSPSSPSSLSLIFHEARHRELEQNVTIRPSTNHQLRVVLEYIEIIDRRQKMMESFDSQLTTSEIKETYGIDGFLHFPPNAFTSRTETDDVYSGSGQVLHSIYTTDKWPGFANVALSNMVYMDSRGAEFSIQSLVIGTLDVVGEKGEQLHLRIGAPAIVTISLRLESNIVPAQVTALHLFSFSRLQKRWLDHGRMSLTHDTSQQDRGSQYWATLQGKLRQVHQVWIVGYPLRLSCWVKAQAFQSFGIQSEVIGAEIELRQSDNLLGRGSFYKHTMSTVAGIGACLKSICSLGGVLSPSHSSGIELEAVTPSISNGIIMGSKDEVMIYTVDKQNIGINGKHPFYPSAEACQQHSGSRSSHFRFVSTTQNHQHNKPTIMLTEPTSGEVDVERGNGFCYLKVAVLDCAAYSDVKAVSFRENGGISSVAFEIASLLGGRESPLQKDWCTKTTGFTHLKASCVDFSCGSTVHVSVQSRMERKQTKSCRYWSSSTSTIPWTIPPSHNLTSFHFIDQGTSYGSVNGIYHAVTKELALMKCNSGSHHEPSNTLDPYKGAAVTFTCL